MILEGITVKFFAIYPQKLKMVKKSYGERAVENDFSLYTRQREKVSA